MLQKEIYIYIYWQKSKNKLIVCEFISHAMKWKWLELKQHEEIIIQKLINNIFFFNILVQRLGKDKKCKEICEWLNF